MFLGNLSGLAGTYLALIMVLLVSRVPMIERVLGQDKAARIAPPARAVAHLAHRRACRTAHFAYAEAARTGVWYQIGAFIRCTRTC